MEIINKNGDLKKLKTPSPFLINLQEKYEELLRVKNELVKYLKDTDLAMGISAPQMGIYLPIFAIKLKDGIENFINPTMVNFRQPFYSREGCMSFPDIQAYVVRFNKISAEYFHFNYKDEIKKMTKNFKDLESAAYQHESDHLLGVTLMDRAASLTEDQAQNLNKVKIERVFRDEEKIDYFLEDEKIYFYSGESVPEFKKEMINGFETDVPLKKSFIGFKIREGE
jgi:peptide deformylase